MRLSDLIVDPATGMLSHTKLWMNIAYCATTFSFIWLSYKGTVTAEIWLIYLAVLGAHGTASKLISLKYGHKNGEQ